MNGAAKFFAFLHFITVAVARSDSDLENVGTHKGFLDAPQFFRMHAIPRLPLLIDSIEKASLSENLDVSTMENIPHAHTAYVSVKNRNGNVTDFLSVGQFLRKYRTEEVYIDSSLPAFIKSLLYLPRSLACKQILDGLRKTSFLLRSGSWEDGLEYNDISTLTCQLSGKAQYRFIKSKESSTNQPTEKATSKSEQRHLAKHIDSSKSTAYSALVEPYSCLFIPSEWLFQKNSSGDYMSFIISWSSNKSSSTNFECTQENKQQSLLDLHFTDDPKEDIIALIEFEDLHHFIKDYYFERTDGEDFERKLRVDKYFDGITEWDEECRDIAQEMFNDMDVDADGVLSEKDFHKITFQELRNLAGKIEDRLADFGDIKEDQLSEKKGSLFDAARQASSQTDEIRKLIEDGFSDIFKDIDAFKEHSPVADVHGNVKDMKTPAAEGHHHGESGTMKDEL